MLRLILIFSLITQTALANQCPDDIQVISKGQVANCDGLLFSPKASQAADEAIEDAKYFKELSDKLLKRQELADQQISLLDKRLALHVEQNVILADQLVKKENQNKWEKVIYFTLGIIVTGVAVHGASKL